MALTAINYSFEYHQYSDPFPMLQVFWLVLAFTQDHPGDRYSVEFRDACERAAVEGYWV